MGFIPMGCLVRPSHHPSLSFTNEINVETSARPGPPPTCSMGCFARQLKTKSTLFLPMFCFLHLRYNDPARPSVYTSPRKANAKAYYIQPIIQCSGAEQKAEYGYCFYYIGKFFPFASTIWRFATAKILFANHFHFLFLLNSLR